MSLTPAAVKAITKSVAADAEVISEQITNWINDLDVKGDRNEITAEYLKQLKAKLFSSD